MHLWKKIMSQFEIILLAIGLSMDCFSVSFTSGAVQKLKFRHALAVAAVFGIFHVIMPLIGWLLGSNIIDFIRNFDHWVSFILLGAIGGKMILDGIKDEEQSFNILKISVLLILALATTIDALAVGVSLACLNVPVANPVVWIGVCSFTLSLIGIYLGRFLIQWMKPRYAEILGGVILVAIGVKILIEHLSC